MKAAVRGDPEIGSKEVNARAGEFRRSHADDLKRLAADANDLANGVRVAGKTGAPQPVTQDHDVAAIGLVGRLDGAAKLESDSQRREVRPVDRLPGTIAAAVLVVTDEENCDEADSLVNDWSDRREIQEIRFGDGTGAHAAAVRRRNERDASGSAMPDSRKNRLATMEYAAVVTPTPTARDRTANAVNRGAASSRREAAFR